MHFRLLAAATVAAFVAACDVASIKGPELAQFADNYASSYTYGCYSDVSPNSTAMTASPDAVGSSCSAEACGEPGGTGLSVTVDSIGSVDVTRILCPDSSIIGMRSDGKRVGSETLFGFCWDCFEPSTSSAVCPTIPLTQECITIPGLSGSDAQKFTCPAGYHLISTGGYSIPTCKKPCPIVPAAPTVTADLHVSLPELSWSAVSGVSTYRVYRRSDAMSEWELASEGPDLWFLDAGVEATGSPQTTAPGGNFVRYLVKSVSETGTESTSTASHYYPYAGGPLGPD